MKRHPTHGRFVAVVAAFLSAGCFSYVPAQPELVPPGEEVRMELTRVGFAQLPEIPNRSGPDLSGRLVRNEAESLVLRVPVTIRTEGFVARTIEQEVLIPKGDLVWIRRRELNRRTTALAVAGGLAALGGLFAAFNNEGPPLGEEPPKEEDPEAGSGLAQVFRFSIPLP